MLLRFEVTLSSQPKVWRDKDLDFEDEDRVYGDGHDLIYDWRFRKFVQKPHECERDCEWPPSPRTCEYNFVAEW